MSDKKLLELAAKAAGYKVRWHENWKCFVHDQANNITQPPSASGDRHVWVPIDDDGDALRLAVTLNLTVSICDEFTKVTHGFEEGIIEYVDGHKERAARMAIVRAAAEIGKNMAD
ncbi:hypothetical protein [Pseudomonas aeruginosa]|uniref:hypothetical protein n=1 Tax=Pseudomonas aeruginosa TaxID=287 RepID=UPI000F548F59|nr:hypothetical protein [Pseudomonas aeruginosa]RQC90054.1 hypothetical protein IPC345_24215 [Pseudomonas aeruginosa]